MIEMKARKTKLMFLSKVFEKLNIDPLQAFHKHQIHLTWILKTSFFNGKRKKQQF